MPQSLAQIYLHLVFSTKDRHAFLRDDDLRDETHTYLGGTCNVIGVRRCFLLTGGVLLYRLAAWPGRYVSNTRERFIM